jgi:hypothetical protein
MGKTARSMNGRFSPAFFALLLGVANGNRYGKRRLTDLFARLVVKLRNFCTSRPLLHPLDKICGVWYKLNMVRNFDLDLLCLGMLMLFSRDFIGIIAILVQSTLPPPPENRVISSLL